MMTVFISLSIVLSTWIFLQWLYLQWRKHRRQSFTPTDLSNIRDVIDDLNLIVTCERKYLNYRPQQATHSVGRLVLTEYWLVLATEEGVLLRVERGDNLKLKDLGKGRWMLLGTTPGKQSPLRIVLVPNGNTDWIQGLHLFCAQ